MKILILSPSFPYPPDTGAAIRIYNIIKYLSRENDVQLISFADREVDAATLHEVEKYCSKVHLIKGEKIPKLLQVPKVIHKFVKGLPFMLKYAESEELKRVLQNITSKDDIDIIQFEHSYMAYNVQYLSCDLESKKVITFHNIASAQYYRIYQLEKRFLKKVKHLLEWVPMFKWESRIAEKFDKSVVVSDVDKYLLQFLNPMLDISVVPNGVDARSILSYPLAGREKNLLFVGTMDYEPNSDAVIYFHTRIFPLIKKAVPELTFTVVGRNPPPEVRDLSRDPDVVVTGHVDDVQPYYRKAMLAVIPLRSGGGTRLKIVEAMSTGTPVVSTSVGCEGLEVQDGENIMVANDPEEFARKAIALLGSPTLWLKVSAGGRGLVERKYDWELITASLQDIYRRLLLEQPQPAPGGSQGAIG